MPQQPTPCPFPPVITCWLIPVVPVLIVLPSADGDDVRCHDIAGAGVDTCRSKRWDACCNCLVMIPLHPAIQGHT